jgi:hypothetical protein
MALIEIGFPAPQNFEIGQSVYLLVKGNFRRWVVEGFNDAKTSIIFSDPFLD